MADARETGGRRWFAVNIAIPPVGRWHCFHEGRKTVVHLHPKGLAVTDGKARGGRDLEFVFYATQPGFVRLFAQVQVEGRSKFAPFGLEVNWR